MISPKPEPLALLHLVQKLHHSSQDPHYPKHTQQASHLGPTLSSSSLFSILKKNHTITIIIPTFNLMWAFSFLSEVIFVLDSDCSLHLLRGSCTSVNRPLSLLFQLFPLHILKSVPQSLCSPFATALESKDTYIRDIRHIYTSLSNVLQFYLFSLYKYSAFLINNFQFSYPVFNFILELRVL